MVNALLVFSSVLGSVLCDKFCDKNYLFPFNYQSENSFKRESTRHVFIAGLLYLRLGNKVQEVFFALYSKGTMRIQQQAFQQEERLHVFGCRDKPPASHPPSLPALLLAFFQELGQRLPGSFL